MKPTNATLNAILAGRQFFIADLITITLQDGTALNYCSGQKDITTGAVGNSLSFNGSADDFHFTTNFGVQSVARSWAGWFKSTALSGCIFGQTSSASDPSSAPSFVPSLYVGTDGKLYGAYFSGAANTLNSTGVVNDGNWHHAAYTVSSTGLATLYLDGSSIAANSGATLSESFWTDSWIANGHGSTFWPNINTGDNWFKGRLFDLRVYNTVITAANVTTLFNAGSVSAGLVGEYPMKTTSSTDASGNGHDGTIQGSPTIVADEPAAFGVSTGVVTTYLAGGVTGPYFDRKDNKAKVVWNLGVGTDTLVIDVLPGTATVEGHTWFDAVRLGLFDGADFEIDRAYSTVYGTVQAGCAPMLFKGRVAEVEADRAIITFSINDYRELLNQQMPRWLYAASCQNALYDASCTLISTNFQSTGSVGAGSSFSFIVNTTLAQASGYFDLGKIKFTSGVNNGLVFPISSWSSSLQTITLAAQTPFLPGLSDQFTIFPGCDLSTGSGGCSKFSNIANFRGMPYIPDPGQAI